MLYILLLTVFDIGNGGIGGIGFDSLSRNRTNAADNDAS